MNEWKTDVLVVGAGAAGMMAAGTAAELGARVVLLEHTDRLGKKLYITGKGRCNVTNCCTPQEVLQNVPPQQPLSLQRHGSLPAGGGHGLF